MARCTTFEFVHHALVTGYPEDLVLDLAADVLVMPVTHPYISKTTGGDAEAWTLADGIPGQGLIIELNTDGGGDGTLTPATSTGWATIVFADAGDQAVLMYVNDTVGWVIMGMNGVSAPPVKTV